VETLWGEGSRRNCFLCLMSLSSRAPLGGVHPWLAERIRFILDYADNWGPAYTITSGVRTANEQFFLFNTPGVVAAQVGCSQHQYGLAVDVYFEDPGWQQWYLSSTRNFGMTTLTEDPVHVQVFPGQTFREWVAAAGYCPDTRYHPTQEMRWASNISNVYRRGFF